MTDSDSEDVPQLSADTLSALLEFQDEERRRLQEDEQERGHVTEDWQLSQFWYDRPTAQVLAQESLLQVENGAAIACVSCPTLYGQLLEEDRVKLDCVKVVLLEFDTRFVTKFGSENVLFYDYKHPLDIPHHMQRIFDLIIFDPPFLSDECLVKVAQTIRLMSKPQVKLIACTGSVMEDVVARILSMKRCTFRPKHKNNLANEFACYANFETKLL